MHNTSVTGSSHQILLQRCIPEQFDPRLIPTDFYMTFDPINVLNFGSSYKFGGHRAFPRHLNLWMTFNLLWGRFENMLPIVVDPFPTVMPIFSLIPQSKTKRMAVDTYIPTYLHAYRLGYFSGIDDQKLYTFSQSSLMHS